MKKFTLIALALSFTFVLAGCKADEGTTDGIDFSFDAEIVKEYIADNGFESNINTSYTLSTHTSSIGDADILNSSFYRILSNGTYVYYTMSGIEVYRQPNDSTSGYGYYLSNYTYEGVIGILDGTKMHFVLEDGTYLGEYPEGYYFDIFSDEYLHNDIWYYVFYVEYIWDLKYIIIENTSTGELTQFTGELHAFNPESYFRELDGSAQDVSTIMKLYYPFFEQEDSEYYYIINGNQYMIYNNDDQLVNSFGTHVIGQQTILVGNNIITFNTFRVDSADEDYTYVSNGDRYKSTMISYNILTDERTLLEPDYVISNYYGQNNYTHTIDYINVQVYEIGPNKTLYENPRSVLINSSGEIVSDLSGFDANTWYDENGYFYNPHSRNLFTEDLTLIGNNITYYSPAHSVYIVETYGFVQCYNMDSEALLEDGYSLIDYNMHSITIEKNDEAFIYSFETTELTSLNSIGDNLFQNDYVTITFNENTNDVNVYDSRTLELKGSVRLTGLDTYANFQEHFLQNEDASFEVGLLEGYIFIETSDGTIKIDYTIRY